MVGLRNVNFFKIVFRELKTAQDGHDYDMDSSFLRFQFQGATKLLLKGE